MKRPSKNSAEFRTAMKRVRLRPSGIAKLQAPKLIPRFFHVVDHPAERAQLRIWWTLSEHIFNMFGWAGLLALSKFVSDKTNLMAAKIIYYTLICCFFGVISAAVNYVEFRPIRENANWKSNLNLLINIIIAMAIFLAVFVVLLDVVDKMSELKK